MLRFPDPRHAPIFNPALDGTPAPAPLLQWCDPPT
jgi:hypothetical protein